MDDATAAALATIAVFACDARNPVQRRRMKYDSEKEMTIFTRRMADASGSHSPAE